MEVGVVWLDPPHVNLDNILDVILDVILGGTTGCEETLTMVLV